MYVIWDWSGTLIDDVALSLGAVNRMLEVRGLEALSTDRYRELYTFPMDGLFRSLGLFPEGGQPEAFTALVDEYVEGYTRRAMRFNLRPGAREALERMKEAGHDQVLITSSRNSVLRKQVYRSRLGGYFESVLGTWSSLPANTCTVARMYLTSRGIGGGGAVFVGDTTGVADTAREIGSRCVLVSGGHESRRRLGAAGCRVFGGLDEVEV